MDSDNYFEGYLSFNVSLKQTLTSTELRGLKGLSKRRHSEDWSLLKCYSLKIQSLKLSVQLVSKYSPGPRKLHAWPLGSALCHTHKTNVTRVNAPLQHGQWIKMHRENKRTLLNRAQCHASQKAKPDRLDLALNSNIFQPTSARLAIMTAK